MSFVKLLYDFEGGSEHELSVREGEVLSFVEDHGDGWSSLKAPDGKIGYVPSNYFETYVPPKEDTSSKKRITISKVPVAKQQPIAAPEPVPQINLAKAEEAQPSSPSQNAEPAAEEPPKEEPKQRGKKDPRTPRGPLKYTEKEAIAQLQKKLKHLAFRKKFKEYYAKNPQFKNLRTRNELVKETLETERTYVSSLTKFIDLYYKPIRESKGTILEEKLVKVLFSNVEQVLSINKMLHDELEKEMEKWPVTRFGASFKKYAPFLKAYTTYVNNFDEAIATYTKLEQTAPEFKKFLSETYANPKAGKHKFDSFAILPIQRIPRYKLLLGDMLKNTPEEHAEYDALKEALGQISTIATFVNESKRKKEQTQVVLELQKALKNRFDTLVQPNRQFLREGDFKVRCPTKSISGDEYRAYLFQDVMLLKELNEKKKAKKLNWIFIFFSFAKLSEKGKGNEFTIELITDGNLDKFTLVSATPEQRETWETDIDDCITTAQKNRGYKGIEKDPIEMGQERINLTVNVKQAMRLFEHLDKEYQTTEKKLSKIDADLRVHEYELRRLMDTIKKEKAEKAKTEQTMDSLVEHQLGIRTNVQQYLKEIKERDDVFMNILGSETDAFKTIFQEEPASEELHTKILPYVRAVRKSTPSTSSPNLDFAAIEQDLNSDSISLKPAPPSRLSMRGLPMSSEGMVDLKTPVTPPSKPVPMPRLAAPPQPGSGLENKTPPPPPPKPAPAVPVKKAAPPPPPPKPETSEPPQKPLPPPKKQPTEAEHKAAPPAPPEKTQPAVPQKPAVEQRKVIAPPAAEPKPTPAIKKEEPVKKEPVKFGAQKAQTTSSGGVPTLEELRAKKAQAAAQTTAASTPTPAGAKPKVVFKEMPTQAQPTTKPSGSTSIHVGTPPPNPNPITTSAKPAPPPRPGRP